MQEKQQEQDLVACISPVINALTPLKLKQSTTVELEEFRESLLASFDEYERNCYSQQVTTSLMQEVKFALTAMCDEFVMSSGAHFRMDWMSRPLQLEFFGNNRAGEEFFERLSKLRTGGEQKLAALEVYYICLQLGFEGIYKVKGIEQLKALLEPKGIQVLVAELPHYKGPSDVFHLMSILSPVDKDLAAVYSALMPINFRNELLDRGFRFIEVPDEEFESMGCNVLAVAPGECLMVAGNPRTQQALELAGCKVPPYNGRHISVPGGGGPTCLTRPLLRSY